MATEPKSPVLGAIPGPPAPGPLGQPWGPPEASPSLRGDVLMGISAELTTAHLVPRVAGSLPLRLP